MLYVFMSKKDIKTKRKNAIKQNFHYYMYIHAISYVIDLIRIIELIFYYFGRLKLHIPGRNKANF